MTSAELPDASEIAIQARHGVRQYYVGDLSGSNDVAMTIYQINISVDEIKKHNWSYISEEEIMRYWRVINNIIPSLQFQMVTF